MTHNTIFNLLSRCSETLLSLLATKDSTATGCIRQALRVCFFHTRLATASSSVHGLLSHFLILLLQQHGTFPQLPAQQIHGQSVVSHHLVCSRRRIVSLHAGHRELLYFHLEILSEEAPHLRRRSGYYYCCYYYYCCCCYCYDVDYLTRHCFLLWLLCL